MSRGDLTPFLSDTLDRSKRYLDGVHHSVSIMFRHSALHDFLHAYRIEELLLQRTSYFPVKK